MKVVQLEVQDTEVQDIAEEISGTLQGAFDLLCERREIALAAAIKPLDAERGTLEQESASIGKARVSLERLLPARARVAQSEADALTLAGDAEGAEAKLQEAQEAADAPAKMIERQGEISARLEAIEAEKLATARRIFESWYPDVQQVIRAAEHGLFCTLLDDLRASFYEYQERTGTGGTLDRPYSFLVKTSYFENLTAPERSQEWTAGESLVFSRGQVMKTKAKGKPKTPPTIEEQQTIVTLAAGGVSPYKIARTIGRSRHLVRNTIAKPEVQRSIQDERAELSVLCKDKARAIFLSIDDDVISKGNLLQRATSGAILIDKALMLAGETPSINVSVLLDVVEALRARSLIGPEKPALPPPEPEL